MTPTETEALYLKHADDLRTLLDRDDALALLGENVSILSEAGLWFWDSGNGPIHSRWEIPASVALAALTEFWRDKLENQHGVYFDRGRDTAQWEALKATRFGRQPLWLNSQGQWFLCNGTTFKSFPQAICAAVHALAEEKRKAQKPRPSDAALRAARRLCQRTIMQTEALVAQIIDEELAKRPKE